MHSGVVIICVDIIKFLPMSSASLDAAMLTFMRFIM